MSDWSGHDLVPSPSWRRGPRRAGLAFGPDGLWLAAVDPDPERPRLVTLLHKPLEGIDGTGLPPAETGLELAGLWERAGLESHDAGLALGPGLATGLQDAPPLPDEQLRETLLANGLADQPLWAGETPVLSVHAVQRTPARVRALWAGARATTCAGWREACDEAGVRLQGIEPFAWAVLRGLLACGDVTPTGRWGLAVFSQGHCWVSIWDGERLQLWREEPGPAWSLTAADDAATVDLMAPVVRAIQAAWRYAGSDLGGTLWVAADRPEEAGILAQLLEDENVPARVPLHMELGPLAHGGVTALAALGEAAAEALRFPAVFTLAAEAPSRLADLRLWRRRPWLVAAIVGGLLAAGLIVPLLRHLAGPGGTPEGPIEITERLTSKSLSKARTADWPLDRVLDQVRHSIPQDAWLTSLEVAEDGQLTLQGNAMAMRSPLLFSWNLDHLAGWRRVHLAKLVNEGGVVAFTLQADLEPADKGQEGSQ